MIRGSFPGEHGFGLAFQIEVGLTADVDGHPLDGAAGEPVGPRPGVVAGDGRAAVAADAQALAGEFEVAGLGLDPALADLAVSVVVKMAAPGRTGNGSYGAEPSSNRDDVTIDGVRNLVTYHESDAIATITMDDGKVNALSQQMFDEVNAALDRAEAAGATVVLAGREGIFSAGFDLGVLRAGGAAAVTLVRTGFELSARLLAFPAPVVIACTGHAIAMGVFLLLSGDFRFGAPGAYRITANEVAIGLTMPRPAIEISRQLLTPAHFNRAMVLAEVYSPDEAAAAGFLDRVVPEPVPAALAAAQRFGQLDRAAHAATKRRIRGPVADAIRQSLEDDARALAASGR